MSKIFTHHVFRGLYYILIFSSLCSSFQCVACDDCFCDCYDTEEDFVNYHELENIFEGYMERYEEQHPEEK